MRKLILISAVLFLTVACIKSDPSWKVNWDNPEYGQKEQEKPKPQPDNPDVPDNPDPTDVELTESFAQEFDSVSPEHFGFRVHDGREDFRYFSAFPSLSERSTDILLLRLDPKDASGAGNGPRLTFDTHSFYGSYSIRVKMPDLSRFKSKTDACFDFGVGDADGGNAVIKIGWKLSDPSKLTLSAIAGTSGAPVNTTLEVSPSEAITKDFSASSLFHTYGFDWTKDGVQWWILNPSTKAKTVIGKTDAPTTSPRIPALISAGAWHSSVAPKYPFEIEIDNISYTKL